MIDLDDGGYVSSTKGDVIDDAANQSRFDVGPSLHCITEQLNRDSIAPESDDISGLHSGLISFCNMTIRLLPRESSTSA